MPRAASAADAADAASASAASAAAYAYAADADAASAAADAADAASASAADAYAFRADVQAIEKGLSADQLAGRKLWPQARPKEITSLWTKMKKNLLARGEDWEVWTEWYDARLAGESSIEALEVARVLIEAEIWEQGPKRVNEEIKWLIEEYTKTSTLPPIPELEAGPVMQVTERGLELVSQPIGDDFDIDLQKNLHTRLQRLLPLLADATHKVANAHPGLYFVISEYGDLIARPFEQLDVASLWAVGTGLLAFRQAFANPANGTMTEPLEPGHLALLQQAAEIHGGFILGFPKGRELTERADQARLSPDIVAQISLPTRTILSELAHAKYFVEEHTRQFLASIEAGLIVNGWETARAGYAGYVVSRNSLIALGKVLLRANSVLATVVGSIVLSSVDPNLVMTKHIIQFTLEHAQIITSFAEPFPELKIWLGSIIGHLDECNPKPRRKG